jgi:RNA polymerase sigma factor for flagellar operon FliA
VVSFRLLLLVSRMPFFSAKVARQKMPATRRNFVNVGATQPALAKVESQKSNARRDALILEHLPLVTAIAAHIQKSLPVHVELDDLVHAGTMGLLEAATKYDSEKQVAFPAYAKHRIRGAILDSLRQLDWASRDLRKRYKQLETTTRELTARMQRTPTSAEVAEAMGLSERRWQSLMIDFRAMGLAAVRNRASQREEQSQQEIPAPTHESPDELASKSEIRQKLHSAMASLPERYRQVVKLYYSGDFTMKEIGGILGVNESRVSQIHKSALNRMQNALAQNGIYSSAAF